MSCLRWENYVKLLSPAILQRPHPWGPPHHPWSEEPAGEGPLSAGSLRKADSRSQGPSQELHGQGGKVSGSQVPAKKTPSRGAGRKWGFPLNSKHHLAPFHASNSGNGPAGCNSHPVSGTTWCPVLRTPRHKTRHASK